MAYVSLDSDQIKKAHKKHKYTKEQVEQLEKCMDQKTGPLYFMKQFMKIQHPTKGEMKFKPFPYQERLIEAYNDHRFSVSMLPRLTDTYSRTQIRRSIRHHVKSALCL